MTRRSLLVAGIGAYLLALLATAPATLADATLQRASAGRLRLAEVRGTLWSGAGLLEVRDARGQTGIAREFAWRIKPLSLLLAHLVCDVRLGKAFQSFPVTLSVSGIELTNADFQLPAAALGLAEPRLAPLGLTGEVLIHVSSLSIARDSMAGEATLKWRAAGSALTKVSPLGDYELRLDAGNRTVNAVLRTIAGPIQFDGTGSWMQGARPVFAGMASVPPELQQELAPLLRMIAVEHGAGKFEFRLD